MSKPVTVDEGDLRLLMEYAGVDIPVEDGEHEVNIVLARCAEALEAKPSADHDDLRQRIDAALQASIDNCARCKTCDAQVDAVMGAVFPALARQFQEAIAGVKDGSDGEGGTAPEPELPPGVYARIELPGYRNHTGWVTEQTRFGAQVAVVCDWDGREMAAVALGPGCQVIYLPTPLKRPEPQAAIECGTGGFGYEVDGPDVAGPDWDWRERDGEPI